MKLLVVGSTGFIAKNLIAALENIISGKDRSYPVPRDIILYEYSRCMGINKLQEFCRDCDFVFFLAGVNRPVNQDEYMEGNAGFLEYLLKELKNRNNACPVMYASSTQAILDNEYGRSKRAGEILLEKYERETGNPVYIYRLTNVFGKWCRPNYNSVVATFCYNIARNLPIRVDDDGKCLKLLYIDDVIDECIGLLRHERWKMVKNPLQIDNIYEVTLKELQEMIYGFRESRESLQIPDMKKNSFSERLYSTYLTYLPKEQLKYPAVTSTDERGSFTELFRTVERGQFSVNITKPGAKKGEHWHHTKNEKFIVVSGEGCVQLRQINSDDVVSYHVSGDKIEVVDIPSGYTHNIINEGKTDLVTVIWANENFRSEKPDTYFLKVEKKESEY